MSARSTLSLQPERMFAQVMVYEPLVKYQADGAVARLLECILASGSAARWVAGDARFSLSAGWFQTPP